MMNPLLKTPKLSGDVPVIGLGICLGSLRIAEMVASTDFDFVMVDLLHSHFSKDQATNAIRVLAHSQGPAPIGRVANNDPGEINDLLDAGAVGIIVPMVNSTEEAAKAVESAYYPPIGRRSKGSPAAVFYGSDYYSAINASLKLIIMIETLEAVEKAEEILKVPGVGGCLIGASDLSFIMKETNQESLFEGCVERVLSIGRSIGVSMGISVNSPEEVARWWRKGAQFFLASHDMAIVNSGIRNHYRKYSGIQNNGGV